MTAQEQRREPRPKVKPWVPILSITLTGISVAIYFAIFVSGDGFERLFNGFGGDLPLLTSVFLNYFKYFGVLALIGLVPCVALLANRSMSVEDGNRLFVFVLVSFGLSLAVLVVFVVAMYLPIFQLGAVV